jgi:hypothetical protein
VKVLRLLTVALLSQSGLTACASLAFSAHGTPMGMLYTEVRSNERVTEAKSAGKKGQACAASILGIVTTGDASVAAAAKAGGIDTVAYVDHSFVNYVGVYSKYCVEVYGG